MIVPSIVEFKKSGLSVMLLETLAFSKGSVLFYMEVVFFAVFGLLFFDKFPDAMTLVGASLIIAGAAWLGLRRKPS